MTMIRTGDAVLLKAEVTNTGYDDGTVRAEVAPGVVVYIKPEAAVRVIHQHQVGDRVGSPGSGQSGHVLAVTDDGEWLVIDPGAGQRPVVVQTVDAVRLQVHEGRAAW